MKKLLVLVSLVIISGCGTRPIEEINIGYIGPLSMRATDLGIGPSRAMELAVEEYNAKRENSQPKVNLFIEDCQWDKERALPAYKKMREEHAIDVLFISNSGGTVAVHKQILEDGVIAVNPLNNDLMLGQLNKNTFNIAKSTEEANGLIGIRIIELGLDNVHVLHYPNDFMTRGANAVKALLDEAGVKNQVTEVRKDQTDFTEELEKCKNSGCEALVFFGYSDFGYAMKQAREMGITAPFFGSTVLLVPEYYDNSEGAIVGTECCFFLPADGNYVLAQEFLKAYEKKYGEEPFSVWPPMQAYDAMNLVLAQLAQINNEKPKNVKTVDWLRKKLLSVRYYQGICGNLSITEDGTSRGIYFSLYKYESKGKLSKVKR